MKKTLKIISVLGLTALSSLSLISCGNTSQDKADNQPKTQQTFDTSANTFLQSLNNQLKPDGRPAKLRSSVQLSKSYGQDISIEYKILSGSEFVVQQPSKDNKFLTLVLNVATCKKDVQNQVKLEATITEKGTSFKKVVDYTFYFVNQQTEKTIEELISDLSSKDSKDIFYISNVQVLAVQGRTIIIADKKGQIINIYDKDSSLGKQVTVGNIYSFVGLTHALYHGNSQLNPAGTAVLPSDEKFDVTKTFVPTTVNYLSTVTSQEGIGNAPANNVQFVVSGKLASSGSAKTYKGSITDSKTKKSISITSYLSKEMTDKLNALNGKDITAVITKYSYNSDVFQAMVLDVKEGSSLTEEQQTQAALYNEVAQLDLTIPDNSDNNTSVFVTSSKDGATFAYAFPQGVTSENLTLSGNYPVSGLTENQIVNLVVNVTVAKDSKTITVPVAVTLGHSNVVTELTQFFGKNPIAQGKFVNVQGIATYKDDKGYVLSTAEGNYNVMVDLKDGLTLGKEYKVSGKVNYRYGSPQVIGAKLVGDAMDSSTVPPAISVTSEEGSKPDYMYALLTFTDNLTVKEYNAKYGYVSLMGTGDFSYSLTVKGTEFASMQFTKGQVYKLTNARQGGINTKHNFVYLNFNAGVNDSEKTTLTLVTEANNQ